LTGSRKSAQIPISKKDLRKEKMKNSTACCDFARDDRDGYVTAELRHAAQYPKPKYDWKEPLRKMVWEMDIEMVHVQYSRCLEEQRKTKNLHRKRELEFIEVLLSNRIKWS
jgi:hypothetical protein